MRSLSVKIREPTMATTLGIANPSSYMLIQSYVRRFNVFSLRIGKQPKICIITKGKNVKCQLNSFLILRINVGYIVFVVLNPICKSYKAYTKGSKNVRCDDLFQTHHRPR